MGRVSGYRRSAKALGQVLVTSEMGGQCGVGGMSGKSSRDEVRVVVGNKTPRALFTPEMALAFAQHEWEASGRF